jgi:hypothetical protein
VRAEPTHLDEASFFDFVAQPAPSVVFLSLHRVHAFSDALPQRVLEVGLESASFGCLALPDLFRSQQVVRFLARECSRCPMPYRGVLPGYYLFCEGELLAYDAGLPVRSDFNHLLRGAAFGAVLYGTTGRATHLLNAVVGAANGAASQRIAAGFAHAFEARRARPREAEAAAREPSESELSWAYGTLGVMPNATDAEVNQAWRKLRLAHHPDHAGSDPEEFTRRTLRSRELNHARDVIFAHRARQRSAA